MTTGTVLGVLLLLQQMPTQEGMVFIPAGTYQIGTDSTAFSELAEMGAKVPHMSIGHARWWFSRETPVQTVATSGFYMDETEVTNAQFIEFVNKSGYQTQGNWQKYATAGRENHPVVNVSWNDAMAFAKWAGKRLPMEFEWEIAARGGLTGKWFDRGDSCSGSLANYRFRGESFLEGVWRMMGLREMNTKPVAGYKPNGYGLFDMTGNVEEWCSNEFIPYTGTVAGQDETPFSSEKHQKMAVRGGHWESPNPVFIRVSGRHGVDPLSASWHRGFRCVKSGETANVE